MAVDEKRIDVISYRTKSHEIKINHLLNPHDFHFPDEEFMWVNQESATLVEDENEKFLPRSYYMRSPANLGGDRIHAMVKDVPGPKFSVRMGYTANLSPDQFTYCGMALRNSTTNRFITFGTIWSTSLISYWAARYTSPLAYSGDYKRSGYSLPAYFFKLIQNDNLRVFQISNDGIHYETFFQTPITDWMTVDQVGFFVGTNSLSPYAVAAMTLFDWKVEAL